MALWQFLVFADAWAAANGASPGMSDDDFDAAAALLDAAPETLIDGN